MNENGLDNLTNSKDEKKFNLFNSNINPNSNSIDIGNKNLENFSSSEKTDVKINYEEKEIPFNFDFFDKQELNEFVVANLKEKSLDLININKFFQFIKSSNISEYLPLVRVNVLINQMIECYIKDKSYNLETISNFCCFLEKEGYTIKSLKNFDPNPVKEITSTNDQLISTKKRNKHILNCPHIERKHYAKNMCNNCYHRQGRNKKAWLCEHSNKAHYAKGRCQNCYSNIYLKNRPVLENKMKADEKD